MSADGAARAVGTVEVPLRRRVDGLLDRVGEDVRFDLAASIGVAGLVAGVLVGLCRVVQMLTVDRGAGVAGWVGGIGVALVALAAAVAFGVAYWRARLDAGGVGAYVVALVFSIVVIGLLVEAFAGITTLCWREGWIEARSGRSASLWAAEQHYLWHLLNSVPLVDVPDTVGWREPGLFDDARSGGLLLGFQVVLIAPLLRLAFGTYQLVEADRASRRVTQRRLALRGIVGRRHIRDLPGPDVSLAAEAWGSVAGVVVVAAAGAGLFAVAADQGSFANRWLEDHVTHGFDIAGRHVGLDWVTAVTPFVVAAGLLYLSRTILRVLDGGMVTWADRLSVAAGGVLAYLLVAALVVAAGTAATLGLVRVGLAEFVPAIDGPAAGAVAEGYAWHMLDALPGPEIASTLHWEPRHLVDGTLAGACVLVAKVAFLAILFFPLTRVARSYRHYVVPAPARPALLEAATDFATHVATAQEALAAWSQAPRGTFPVTFPAQAPGAHDKAALAALDDVFTALDPLVALFGDTPPVHTAYYAVSELCHWYDQESADSGSPAFYLMDHEVARRRLADLARYGGLDGRERLRSDLGDEHRERARRAAAEYAATVSDALRVSADAIAGTPPARHTDEATPPQPIASVQPMPATPRRADPAPGPAPSTLAAVTRTAPRPAEFRRGHGRLASIWSVTYSPDGALLATGGTDKAVRLWDPATRRATRTLTGHTADEVTSVAFSPDALLLASAGWDGTVRLWDPTTGEAARTLTGGDRAVQSVAFSPDGTVLAGARADKTIGLWDPTTGRSVGTLTGHTGSVHAVGFSPDGTVLASGSSDDTVRLWNPTGGRSTRSLTGHAGLVHAVVFSPDGRRLASGSADQTIRLWDPSTGRSTAVVTAHAEGVASLAWSPDGTVLASSGWDNMIRLWDPTTNRLVRTLTGRNGTVLSLAFAPDGRRLVSAGEGTDLLNANTMRLWLLAT